MRSIRYYLIDNWKFDPDEHNPFQDTTENFSNFAGRVHREHYGNDPNEHQEQNYQEPFLERAVRPVVRARSVEGIESLPDSHLDVTTSTPTIDTNMFCVT